MRWNWRPPGSCAVQVSRQDDGNNAGVPPIGPGRHVVCFVVRVVAAAEDVRVLESGPVPRSPLSMGARLAAEGAPWVVVSNEVRGVGGNHAAVVLVVAAGSGYDGFGRLTCYRLVRAGRYCAKSVFQQGFPGHCRHDLPPLAGGSA